MGMHLTTETAPAFSPRFRFLRFLQNLAVFAAALSEMLTSNGGQPELVLRAVLGASQMAGHNHPGTGLAEVLQGGD